MKKLSLTIWLIATATHCFAGWPVGKGRTITSVTYDWFRSSKYFNGQGALTNIGGTNDYFTSSFISLSFTHGIKRRVDITASVPFLTQKSVLFGSIYQRSGLGDAQFGITFHKENFDYTKSLSVQVSGIAPLYSNTNQKILLGYESFGGMVDVNYSVLPKFLKSGYLIFDAAYKQYFAEDGPSQFLYSIVISSSIDKFNQIVGSVSGVSSFSVNKQFSALNPNVVKDYTSITATATYGRRLTRTFSIYLTGNLVVWGVNTGQGAGLGISGTLRIP